MAPSKATLACRLLRFSRVRLDTCWPGVNGERNASTSAIHTHVSQNDQRHVRAKQGAWRGVHRPPYGNEKLCPVPADQINNNYQLKLIEFCTFTQTIHRRCWKEVFGIFQLMILPFITFPRCPVALCPPHFAPGGELVTSVQPTAQPQESQHHDRVL